MHHMRIKRRKILRARNISIVKSLISEKTRMWRRNFHPNGLINNSSNRGTKIVARCCLMDQGDNLSVKCITSQIMWTINQGETQEIK
jgi:hypothetical protein